jgi:laminin gamma 1
LGCSKCFCFGHSSECTSSEDYYQALIISNFDGGLQEWKAIDNFGTNVNVEHDSKLDAIFIKNNIDEIWFEAPSLFLRDQRKSYNQNIQINLIFPKESLKQTRKDIVIENSFAGLKIYRQLLKDSSNTNYNTQYIIQLKESSNWTPTLSEYDFQRLLSNITSLHLRASLTHVNNTFLTMFSMSTATKSNKSSINKATWIEQCKCPIGYTGEHCEFCSEGYRREVLNGNAFTRCVPCVCNNHSSTCDQQTGRCNCIHYTTGHNCQNCQDGYYGNALNGNSNDCKKCQCPNDGSCVEILNHHTDSIDIACLNCPEGTQGNLCEICEDGYFMNPKTNICEKCFCNDNIDENAILNCDSSDGTCLKCIYNTTGNNCEKCLNGYWGNALTEEKCYACDCNSLGTINGSLECDVLTGQCKCKPNVIGNQCNQCEETYWNISSQNGCDKCNCDPLGSINMTCNMKTGQCFCKQGVSGIRCDQCMPNYFDLSDDGCKPCKCDPIGSENFQCDAFGKCVCKKNIVGEKCKKCIENFFDFASSCTKCEDCYGLVVNKVKIIRENVLKAKKSLDESPKDFETIIEKLEMKERLDNIKLSINTLHSEYFGLNSSGFDEFLKLNADQMKNISYQLKNSAYETKKEKFQFLNEVDNYLGNLELELHAIEINIEDMSTQLQQSEMDPISSNNNKTIQDLAKNVRKQIENDELIVSEFESNVNNEIKNVKNIITKTSEIKIKLRNTVLDKAPSSIDISEHVAINNVIRDALKKDTESYAALINKLEDNKIDSNLYNNIISKFDSNDNEMMAKVFVFFIY